jgi:hypothetical protein
MIPNGVSAGFPQAQNHAAEAKYRFRFSGLINAFQELKHRK